MKTIPVGVEKVLYTAALDEEFKKELFQNCETAIRARGFKIRESELKMLRMIPAPQLQAAIDSIDTSSDNLERRTFMRAVAASAATVAAAEVLKGCAEDTKSMGIQPDDVGINPDGIMMEASPTRGILPDMVPSDAGPSDIAPEVSSDTIDDSNVASYGIRPKG